ncbi:MAG: pyridoxal phosphate-dependent aminotransferase [Sphaerochaetaceae bacterium]
MQVSKRIEELTASPIRRLVPYANAAKRRGVHVFHLNIGQPDIKTPPQVLEAIQNYSEPIIKYGESEGDRALREAIPQYYRRFGVDIASDEILITTGGSEALQFTFLTLCDPQDEVIICEPYYTNVGAFAHAAQVTLKPVTSRIEEGFSLPPLEEFEKAVTPKTKAILLCSPNNPTGYVYKKRELEQILDLVQRKDLFLIVDEVYREFTYTGEGLTSILSYTAYSDRVVVVDSFSKRFSMCGARIGTLISRNPTVIKNALKLAQARLCPPNIEQVAAIAALQSPPEYLQEIQTEYQKRRDFLAAELSKIEGVFFNKPRGAFYLLVRLPVEDAEDFCRFLLEDFQLNGQTVMLAPADGFYVTPTLGKNEVRMAYVLNTVDLKHAVACLKAALKEYKR